MRDLGVIAMIGVLGCIQPTLPDPGDLPEIPATGENSWMEFPSGQRLATDVGESLALPVTAQVGPEGGVLVSEDGRLSVTIPTGALAERTVLAVEPIVNEAPSGIGVAYRLGPSGTHLAKPLRLTFSVLREALPGSSIQALGIAWQQADGAWGWGVGATYDAIHRTVSVEIEDLADVALVVGFRVLPDHAWVAIGRTVEFKITSCVAADEGRAVMIARCQEVQSAEVNRWYANRIDGGDESVGTIVKGETGSASGIYTAPKEVPYPRTVQLAGRWFFRTSPTTVQALQLDASVDVLASRKNYSGTFLYIDPMGNEITGSVVFNKEWPMGLSETESHASELVLRYPSPFAVRYQEPYRDPPECLVRYAFDATPQPAVIPGTVTYDWAHCWVGSEPPRGGSINDMRLILNSKKRTYELSAMWTFTFEQAGHFEAEGCGGFQPTSDAERDGVLAQCVDLDRVAGDVPYEDPALLRGAVARNGWSMSWEFRELDD